VARHSAAQTSGKGAAGAARMVCLLPVQHLARTSQAASAVCIADSVVWEVSHAGEAQGSKAWRRRMRLVRERDAAGGRSARAS
jgi:hypothetical protein